MSHPRSVRDSEAVHRLTRAERHSGVQLVENYPHLLVLPEYQGHGMGTCLMQMLMARYDGFHQHMLVADGRAIEFYRKCGFERAGKSEPMWI